ncbi:hypothetical protein OG474_41925 [Kribbella sp. NBC_01505]|uniref:hypothetical protein n=1 Tax=Kribbella sp. NBC_01505 TaxID=2903580 RepID=UPI00386F3887
MNEEDLKEALQDAMVRSSPPTSMDPASALEQARLVRKRRRTAWAAVAGVTLAVGALAGPTLIINLTSNASDQMVAGGPSGLPSSTAPADTPKPASTILPSTRKSEDPWPEGQSDRTATTGPRADRSVTLMRDLSSAVPAGFTTPDLKYEDGRSMRWPQTQYASGDGEPARWDYMATIPVQKDKQVGQLLVLSTTPDGKPAGDVCELAQQFWGGKGTCAVVDVAGKKVGVVTTKGQDSYDSWAAYRYDDGTVVTLAQAKKTDDSSRPALKQPIFTAGQLAEQVTSEKFKISN